MARSRERLEKRAAVEAKVIWRLGEFGRRSCFMPKDDAKAYARKYNRRMRRIGCEWRVFVMFEP